MFDKVVIGVDNYEAGRDAIELAKHLASNGGDLSLVYVEVIGDRPAQDSGAVRDARVQQFARDRLGAPPDGFKIADRIQCVEARSVRRGLHDWAASQDADLLVVGSSHRGYVGRLFLGDDTRAVLEGPPCDVAVAPAGYRERSTTITKIGVAYDGTPESQRALAVARRLATDRRAKVSVFEAVLAPLRPRTADVESEIDEHVEEARKEVATLGGVEPHAEYADDAVDALTRYGASVDLLVMGAHRPRAADHLMNGGKSQRLADDSAAPMLVLSSPAAGSTGAVA
jgi:nucleotide-binding universal stress UspA family protein